MRWDRWIAPGLVVVLILLGSSTLIQAQVAEEGLPEGISPGAQGGWLAASSCPTFSWVAEPTGLALQLAVFELGQEFRHPEPRPVPLEAPAVILESLPSGATSWTPPLRLCLEAGNRYAWSVARQVEDMERQWSPPRFFLVGSAQNDPRHSRPTTSRLPTAAQTRSGGLAENMSVDRAGVATSSDPSALNASANDPATEFGLVGITDTADGAGLAAENTQGGADLILFGDNWLLRMTEAGIEVGAPLDVVYAIRNSDASGTLTLLIDQVPALTAATGTLKTHTHEAPEEPE